MQCTYYTGEVIQEITLPDKVNIADDILSLCLTSDDKLLTMVSKSKGLIQYDINHTFELSLTLHADKRVCK